MPFSYVCYPTPVTATVTLSPDSGGVYTGVPYTHSSGRAGQVCYIDAGTPDEQGVTITVAADGYLPLRLRGFLMLNAADDEARFQADDFALELAPVTPGPTPPANVSGSTPLEVINSVWATGDYQLLTKEGCGRFTEACDTAVHDLIENTCGHLRKDPGQNQFNGHAVDAIHFIAGQYVGIWDIITSSESSDAKPAFNYAGPAEPPKWYYPAAPLPLAQAAVDTRHAPATTRR